MQNILFYNLNTIITDLRRFHPVTVTCCDRRDLKFQKIFHSGEPEETALSQKNIRWLLKELPKLVERNIISLEQQHALAEYYNTKKNSGPGIALVVFSIFGATLLAAGIILIFAHNWTGLSRTLRTVLSFLPLVGGQALGFWTIIKGKRSIAWREGISAFIFLAIGSTIALISQTYHISGELKTFLFTWMILAIPLIYVFESTVVSILYLAGISSWAITAANTGSSALAYWLFFAGIIPQFLLKNRDLQQRKQRTIIGWFISLSLIVAIFVTPVNITEGFRTILFIALFLNLSILGTFFNTGLSIWSNPFHRVGVLGLSVMYLFLSYRHHWGNLSYHAAETYRYSLEITGGDRVVSFGLPLLSLILVVFAFRRKNWTSLGMAIGLPLTFLGFGFTESPRGEAAFTAIFNLYVFAGGIAYMVSGIQSNEGKTVNFGFALIAAVIILRFFDSDLSFVLRGIIFVILGAGFLLTNIFIAKRRAA